MISAAKRSLALLAGLFTLPMALAWLLYYSGWQPNTVSRGVIVQPAYPIKDHSFETLSGDTLRFYDLRGKWQLVYFDSAECLGACEQMLYTMRQTRIALGKNTERLGRVFVLTNTNGVDALRYTLEKYSGTQVLRGPATQALMQEFTQATRVVPEKLNGLYLVDPQSNLVLHFPATMEMKNIHKDISRLMRLSRTG